MKNRLLLPAAVLVEPSLTSVDRILDRDFWRGRVRGGEAAVIPLRREPRAPRAEGSESAATRLPTARNR